MRERLMIPPSRDGSLWRYRARPVDGAHCHDQLELNLVVRGTVRYLVAERRYDLRRHSAIWLHPDQEHVLLDPSPDAQMWILVIDGAVLRRRCRQIDPRLLHRNPPWVVARPLAAGDSNTLDDLFERLAAIGDGPDDDDRFNLGLAFATLEAWAAFERADEEVAHRMVDPEVDLAARLLGRGDAPASRSELARRVGLSPTQLSRRFQAQLGVAMVDYRNRARLERFLDHHVVGGRKSILEAALAAGFGSYPQFHRVFRQVLGMAPRAYLAQRESRTG